MNEDQIGHAVAGHVGQLNMRVSEVRQRRRRVRQRAQPAKPPLPIASGYGRRAASQH